MREVAPVEVMNSLLHKAASHLRQRLYRNKDQIKKLLSAIHYEYRPWTRAVMYDHIFSLLEQMNPHELDVLEISGDYWQRVGFRSFSSAHYPQFDICKDRLDARFDLIIADQVFEHVLRPYQAGRHVHAMLRTGGHFLIATPFLIRVHEVPYDCSRWTETGIKYLLHECGFPLQEIRTFSWGNRACVKGNFKKWTRAGWLGSLKNEPDFPVVVWALARK